MIAQGRWTEIDPVEFLNVFESLSEEARARPSNPVGGHGSESGQSLERLVTAAIGGPERTRGVAVRLHMPDYAYLAEIGEQLQRYQQGAAALAVFEAVKTANGGDSTAVLEERIFTEMLSRANRARESAHGRGGDRASFSTATQTASRGPLSESALRVTAAAAARELMLAYRPLVSRLKTELAVRRHFGMNEGKPR